jgi:lysophospholipase L1-like esterase
MGEAEKKEVWDDGLHFTPKGYEIMGEMVAERLLEIFEAEKAAGGGQEVIKI